MQVISCYAYQIGTDTISYRANDDGEPSNSAGMPIYWTNTFLFSHKHTCSRSQSFGGVKLGVGGLISAYKTTAQHTRKL
jgi:putative IMPACT (imprinted ancient) family translation regulator